MHRGALVLALLASCSGSAEPSTLDAMEGERAALVRTLRSEGVTDERVLAAIGRVPRHAMIPAELRDVAYENRPLPIGYEQTISQPYVVAVMTELAELEPPCRVLEVGTGSGYQAAVLAELGCEVFTIEIVEPLADTARAVLAELGYTRVHVRAGDGYRGWPEHAPFDAVIITAAPPSIPEPLIEQLRVGGTLVAPIGPEGRTQRLVAVRRTESGLERRSVMPVLFVPMTGEAQGE